ncbi:glycosyl transferase family 2 [Chthoniobacter flavus Ellin428]|uniref:Glycosyl transferase family 2 n=1 Tax=Chthoniobacter flavus Ellin428 TaxID=497964 RepID=B4D1K0_9BACT|nr:glycosyltransferase family 2 protein [Chthoniobacter flavus]EDY19612.1 glycosyl transferase family 2 [Chthoniobacter flavus Ellin428]TCO92850.1 glycosyl transferase family 2 [Chthoniobacter flavus]
MSAGIRLSIALVTRNRPANLRRCLASLRAQEAQPFEIIVSDDSDDPSAAVAIAKEFGANHVVGPRRGLYANRNVAALACHGSHIRTMDDDHTLPQGHLRACLEAVERQPNALWTCGEQSFIDEKPNTFTAQAAQLHPSGVASAIADPDDNWAIADGATIYPREVFDRGFRYVEEFGYGSSYLEFGALLYARGWPSRCVPGAFVEHHDEAAAQNRRAPLSCLYASLCYNLYFRPNLLRTVRYAARHAAHFGGLPRLLRLARERWQP